MKKLLVAISALCVFGFASTASAQAEDWASKAGAFGVGVDGNVDGGTGLSLRYMVAESVGLELMFGGNMNSTKSAPQNGPESTTSSSTIDLSLLGEFRIATSRKATLSAFLGFGFTSNSGSVSQNNTSVSESYSDIAFELGLRGEIFLYDFFSVFGRVGVTIDPVSDKETETLNGIDDPNGQVDNTGMNIGLFRGDVLGNFGFTFWFG